MFVAAVLGSNAGGVKVQKCNVGCSLEIFLVNLLVLEFFSSLAAWIDWAGPTLTCVIAISLFACCAAPFPP